ncbi:3-keto-disaccharide hydrolase [Paraglaciecola chathamensis]|uniref:3-keto-disaccharide hydrolase n=1 Tax=Paraglaciecola chathamensis TaxID=368405 RepID=UPI0027054D71|nr:DUF1080 domain-containing protein [Paraglaciecola chathamensis]MDO6560734.1 DUF1080 domain-containing protein [Paraglaciecola chathamensis]
MTFTKLCLSVFLLIILAACAQQAHTDHEWKSLFNGQNLDGWTVKIHHHEVGDNFADTFRVENGLLRVSYDQYDTFDKQFGHLYFNKPYANFHLKLDYRFYGEFMHDAPHYALRNSGVMYYSQAPKTILKEQDWPISVEMQFLAGLDDGKARPTGNMCSPGTEIDYQGVKYHEHCLRSSSPTLGVDEWVSAELIVKNGKVTQIINGQTVLQYDDPEMGGKFVKGYDPAVWTPGKKLTSGYIALQSEGHPIEFKNIEIKAL